MRNLPKHRVAYEAARPIEWSRTPPAQLPIPQELRLQLDRRLHLSSFPDRHPCTFVVEADPPASPLRLDSLDGFRVKDDPSKSAAPVSRVTDLVPTETNAVETWAEGRTLVLAMHLATPLGRILDELGEDAELDLYCAAEHAADLDAFRELMHGRWPRAISLPDESREVWPRLGVRPFWARTDGGAEAGPESILNLTRHAYEERFLRLPMRRLGDREQARIEIRVELGDRVDDVARALEGRLRLNAVLFSDRTIRISDRAEYLEIRSAAPGDAHAEVRADMRSGRLGSPPVVLEVADQDTGTRYADGRWGFALDPLRRFVAESDPNNASALRLYFASRPGPKLRVTAVTFSETSLTGLRAGSSRIVCTAKRGLEFGVIGEPTSAIGPEAYHAFRSKDGGDTARAADLRLMHWMASGFARIAPGRLYTRRDLAEAAFRLAPEALRRSILWSEDPVDTARFRVEMRPVPVRRKDAVDSGARPCQFVAQPLLVIVFPAVVDQAVRHLARGSLEGIVGRQGDDYEREWLARTLEMQTEAGTRIEVRIDDQDYAQCPSY